MSDHDAITTTTVSRREGAVPSLGAVTLSRVKAEFLAFFRQRESVVFTLAFPVLLLVLFAAIFGGQNVAKGVPFTQYFLAGMIAAGLMSSSFQSLAIQIPIERDDGLLKRLRGTPTPKAAYFLGKVVLVLGIALISTVIMLIIGMIAYGISLPPDIGHWAVFFGILILSVAACTLLGIAFSSLPRNGSSAPAMVTPIALILQFISGVFLPFTTLPHWLQQVGAIFPLKWMAQGLRYSFLPDRAKMAEAAHEWEIGKAFLFIGLWAIVGLVLCLLTFRWRSKADG